MRPGLRLPLGSFGTGFNAVGEALLLAAGFFLLASGVPEVALAQGAGGDPHDRLDWAGAPTDRYLTADEVRDVLHKATDAFYACFRTHVRGGDVANEVSVEFTVDREGRGVEVLPQLGQAPATIGPCLREVVGGLDFGDHDGDPLEVAYPLVYQVDRRGARILPYPIVFTRPQVVRLPLLALPADVEPGELRLLEKVFVEDLQPPPDASKPPTEAGTPAAAEPNTDDPSQRPEE